VISYLSITDPPGTGPPCSGQGNGNDAACPDIFIISGDLVTNLVSGDNVLAVEVHQAATTSPDIVFGCALSYAQTVTIPPTLNFFYERNILSLYWNGSGFTLQQADELNGSWTNTVVTNSPYILEIPPDIKFFQLRK
jgi:hypothetical protein